MFSFLKKKKKEVDLKIEEIQEEDNLTKTIKDDEAYANPVEIKEEEIVELEKPQENIQKEENKEEKKGFFSRALEKTFATIKTVVPQKQEKISFDDVQELLIEADMEYEIIEKAMDGLPLEITRKQLRHRLVMLFEHAPKVDLSNLPKPFVRLIIGVNGAGKTTTIAKLANISKKSGKSVILGAGDTFRAAAIEQLSAWASKLDVPIIKTKQGHDASAVAYDTITAGIARNIDNVIIDTAGRLQTQINLNNELKKIVKVCSKAMPHAPHQKLMILDGTQGNTAIAQARAFNEMVGIDGIIVTKLDGTAKGGALFSISNQLELPIFYVGVGEKQDDLIEFSPDDFVDSLLDEIYTAENK
jgi:fused signal recognition particle receptor